MKNINEVLPKNLRVAPLKGNQVAEFRLLRAGMIDVRTGKPVSPAGHLIPGKEMCFDRETGETILIGNIVGVTPISQPGRETVYDPEFKSILFPSTGSVYCNAEKNDQFFFLMRSMFNRDNTERSNKYPPIFFMVDHERDAKIEVDSFEYRRLAMNIVAEANDQELIAIGYGLNQLAKEEVKINMNDAGLKLRRAIGGKAEHYASDVIMVSSNVGAKMRVTVDKAIFRKTIMFDNHPDKRLWFWQRNPGEKGQKNIVKIEKGNDPVRGLVDYLLIKEGSQHKAEIETLINNVETYAEVPEA